MNIVLGVIAFPIFPGIFALTGLVMVILFHQMMGWPLSDVTPFPWENKLADFAGLAALGAPLWVLVICGFRAGEDE